MSSDTWFDLHQFCTQLIISSSSGIIGIDNQENVVLMNQAAGNIMGVREAEEVLNNPFSLLLQKTGNTDSILLSTLRNGIEYDHVEAVIDSFSGPINVLAYTSLIKNENGEILGAYMGMRDITPQKQLEEQMHQTEKFYAIGELAAGIAHEVRNPLTSVRGFLQLFNQNIREEDPNKTYLEIMLKEIERANSIINQFLLLSKPVLPIRKEVDLAELLNEVKDLLTGEVLINNIEITLGLDKALPLVIVDRDQIKQVILNIAQNGINAMLSGGTLSIETLYEKDQNKAHIIISDNGMGIDPMTLEKIFDPFFTTRAEGTGLGLTVSYKIIQNHEGKIEVQSEVGKGTTFRIVLPVTRVNEYKKRGETKKP